MAINFRRLQALRAVIEMGSITEAAHVMSLTQSGVSRLIAALEDDIGFPLFTRSKGRLQVNQRGEAFYEVVMPLLTGLDQVPVIADEIRQYRHSRLRIVTLNSQAHGLVPLALERFTQAHPDTAISVSVRSRRELIHWADGDHFDIALAALPLEQRRFEQSVFTRFPVVVALPVDHPLCQQQTVSAKNLETENLISLDPYAIFQTGVRARFQELGVAPVSKLQTTSMLIAGQMVAQGLGVAIIDPFIAHTIKSENIEFRPFAPTLEYEYGYIWPAGRTLSPLAQKFAEAVTSVAEELSASWRT